MAYLLSIEYRCTCGKKASVELRTQYNAPVGKFCKACGKRALHVHSRAESRLRDRNYTNPANRDSGGC